MHLHQPSLRVPRLHGHCQALSHACNWSSGDGAPFQVAGDNAKQPYWFHTEHLMSPKTVRLEASLVEALFGTPRGEHIPRAFAPECVSQTLLRINQWDPEGKAEILIFGQPSYQKDVSKMIMNLAHYHRQRWAQGCGRTLPRRLSCELLRCKSDSCDPGLPQQSLGGQDPAVPRLCPGGGNAAVPQHSLGGGDPELPQHHPDPGSQVMKAFRGPRA